MLKSKSLSVLAGSAGLLITGLLVTTPAQAAPIVGLFTSDHCTGTCGTAPFGSVTLTQTGTTVDVDVHLFAGNAFAKTGAADDQAFKFNATGVVLADITVDAHIPGLVAATGAFNGDGTGNFAFGINCPSCGGGGSSAFSNDIIFHVASATIADLTAPNNLGNIFVADLLGANGNTGPVDVSVVPAPPIGRGLPGILAVGGVLLFGTKLFGRSRKRGSPGTAIPYAAA
jgi:hypothetical protein